MAASHTEPAVVVAGKDSVATDLGELRVGNGAVLGSFEEYSTAAVNCPVTAQQRLFGLHEGAGSLAEGDILEMNMLGGALLATDDLDEVG